MKRREGTEKAKDNHRHAVSDHHHPETQSSKKHRSLGLEVVERQWDLKEMVHKHQTTTSDKTGHRTESKTFRTDYRGCPKSNDQFTANYMIT
ncbi:hypothetical protein L1987_46443 [Smallanthus sonchifolius]|uniref:Uncharacterized protein n=1 Tax=Smallanthus sonchifolius TaxID=185202 RepID=A0ACB9G0R0_9ASTR|nr:hypothetical protein L1987_46443 [Smallanthus sonchifolius]